MKDFYYILGVDTNCSSIEIKEAYRKLSKKFHPDVNQNDKYFEGRFREIHEAYIILNDPTQRAIYDRNLKKFKSPPTSGNTSSSQQQQRTQRPTSGAYYQARPTASYKATTRSIDILFTIILIVVTVVFANYVYKVLNTPLTSKPYSVPVVNAVSYVAPAKHYHHKHSLKIKPINNEHKVSSASVIIPPVRPAKAAATAIEPVPEPVIVKAPAPVLNYLYKSTIHSNLTGIVNMRETAKFSSAMLKEIPDNSEVYVLEKGSAYYKVRFDGVEGFIPKWTVVVK